MLRLEFRLGAGGGVQGSSSVEGKLRLWVDDGDRTGGEAEREVEVREKRRATDCAVALTCDRSRNRFNMRPVAP
jgi:hypothetical protein